MRAAPPGRRDKAAAPPARVTEPSSFWKFSSTATSVRPTARPEPFSVWTNSFLPCALLKRVCMRRAWNASQFETELISR